MRYQHQLAVPRHAFAGKRRQLARQPSVCTLSVLPEKRLQRPCSKERLLPASELRSSRSNSVGPATTSDSSRPRARSQSPRPAQFQPAKSSTGARKFGSESSEQVQVRERVKRPVQHTEGLLRSLRRRMSSRTAGRPSVSPCA